MIQSWMSLTAILIVGIALAYFVAMPLERKINNFLKRKIEEYKFKKDCHKYAKEELRKVQEEKFKPAPEQVNNWGVKFESLKHTDLVVEHKFKRGELRELILKHIKTRKVTTVIGLKTLTNAKENSIRKCLDNLKKDGVVESRRIGKTKYRQYYLKKDVDTVTEK